MRTLPFFARFDRALRRVLHLLAHPAKKDLGQGGIVIQPYRGFGSLDAIFLMGRVFRQAGRGPSHRLPPFLRDAADLLRRVFRRGVSHAVLEIRFNESARQVKADRRGHFQAYLRYKRQNPSDRLWHPVRLGLVRPAAVEAGTVGQIFIPPQTAKFVVISDIDDTVIFTGVANKLLMTWRLFMQNAKSRTAFPGVAAFYRALHCGASGGDLNPMLYVSRGPWSIYEVLTEFFNYHQIPHGPILFLRDWGLALYRPFPPQAKGHKLALIQRILSIYSELPLVLIGDSGQRDPEIYAEIVRTHPGRVLSIYIRKVGKDPLRDRAIEKLAREVAAAGSSLLLAADSFDMAAHAAEHGLISPSALAQVLKERRQQAGASNRSESPVETGNRAP